MEQFVWWILLGSLLVLMVAALSVIFCCANTLRGKKKKKKEGEKRDCEGAGWKRWTRTVFNCNFSPPTLCMSDEVKTGTEQHDVSSIQRLGRESKATLVSRQTCSRCLMMLCNTQNRHLQGFYTSLYRYIY